MSNDYVFKELFLMTFFKDIPFCWEGKISNLFSYKVYLNKKLLSGTRLGRGFAWLDTGTQESLMQASEFIYAIEKRQGLAVGCLEEIAYNNKWIDEEKIISQQKKFRNSLYGDYIKKIIAS